MESAERAQLSRATLVLRDLVQVTPNPACAKVTLDGYSYPMPANAAGARAPFLKTIVLVVLGRSARNSER